jgi:hypothetical protein
MNPIVSYVMTHSKYRSRSLLNVLAYVSRNEVEGKENLQLSRVDLVEVC